MTPADAGALDVLQKALEGLGFTCTRLPFSDRDTPDIDNLYAKLGTEHPHLCFAGHTDVVPVGDEAAWSVDPFAGEIRDGMLIGRGASDMKGAIAAFTAAVARFLEHRKTGFNGAISFLITGDEEGPAINGTKKMLGWVTEQGEQFDHCLVGEPTNPNVLGDMVKIGRRGSLNAQIVVRGTQGHVAYPHLADNPVPKLLEILNRLTARDLDQGTDHFQPSNLEITSVDVGNPSNNVIPAEAIALVNIRFNTHHTLDSLISWIDRTCAEVCEVLGGEVNVDYQKTGNAFLTEPGRFSSLVSDAIADKYGKSPDLSTSGGTSDARFIKDYCTRC